MTYFYGENLKVRTKTKIGMLVNTAPVSQYIISHALVSCPLSQLR